MPKKKKNLKNKDPGKSQKNRAAHPRVHRLKKSSHILFPRRPARKARKKYKVARPRLRTVQNRRKEGSPTLEQILRQEQSCRTKHTLRKERNFAKGHSLRKVSCLRKKKFLKKDPISHRQVHSVPQSQESIKPPEGGKPLDREKSLARAKPSEEGKSLARAKPSEEGKSLARARPSEEGKSPEG